MQAKLVSRSEPPQSGCEVPAVDAADVWVSVAVEDLHNVPRVRQFTDRMNEAIRQAVEEGRERVAVDLQEVQRVGSAGLNGLIAANSEARCDGLRVVLVNVSKNVREVFTLTRLERLFDFVEQ